MVKALAMKTNNILTTQLKNIMTKKVVYININTPLIEAIETLKTSGFRHLPIFDDKSIKFYGIVSYKDFLLGGFY